MAMTERYEPQEIEAKWQQRWEADKVFQAGRRPGAPKKYVLEMLPYPSGQMHMGHVRNYLLGDVYARYFAMKGFDVLHPMGWDAFGLPAENAAIKEGVHPAVRTAQNIASFKKEIRSLGYAYDFPEWHKLRWGIGAVGSIILLPDDLRDSYGTDVPLAATLFARVKI